MDNASEWQRLFDKAMASDQVAAKLHASKPNRIGLGKKPSAVTEASRFHKVESLLELHQIVCKNSKSDKIVFEMIEFSVYRFSDFLANCLC